MAEKDKRPAYIKDEEIEDVYKPDFPGHFKREELEKEREKIVERVIVKQKQAIPREDENVETIKRVDYDIIGSIFDRVAFLEQRIKDLRENLDIRKGLNESMNKEIDEDVRDKKTMLAQAIDMDERRNIMLDISLLRREKRNEQVRFWKDMYELNAELTELMERYEVESKIVALFKDLTPEAKDEAAKVAAPAKVPVQEKAKTVKKVTK